MDSGLDAMRSDTERESNTLPTNRRGEGKGAGPISIIKIVFRFLRAAWVQDIHGAHHSWQSIRAPSDQFLGPQFSNE